MVFEDDAMLVVDKPAGVAVHGGSGVSFGVIEQLRAARPEAKFLELVQMCIRDSPPPFQAGWTQNLFLRFLLPRRPHPRRRYPRRDRRRQSRHRGRLRT